MAHSAITRRIQWLHPVEREVYQTWRVFVVRDEEGTSAGPCTRCGNEVRTGDVGYATRLRGTKWKDAAQHVIHRRCVPTTQFERAGLPARSTRRQA